MISETDLFWLCAIDKLCALREIKSVCDLGCQQVFHTAGFPTAAQRFAELCGCPEAYLDDCRSSADLWRRLNREIVSLDLRGSDNSFMRFDLNTDVVPGHLRAHFDLVANIGTSEHVFNQQNCFRAIHDLTKTGGLMLHSVPMIGHETHGLFVYPISFFWHLCKANNYQCLDAWLPPSGEMTIKNNIPDFVWNAESPFGLARSSEYHPVTMHRWERADYCSADSSIRILLRKNADAAFCTPMDLPD